MNRTLSLLATIATLVAACAPSTPPAPIATMRPADTPLAFRPQPLADAPQPLPGGPYTHQVQSATSADGLTWALDNRVLIEHASVPAAIVTPEGKIRLYYVDASKTPENVNCAESPDGGATFSVLNCTIANRAGDKAVDPSIVRLSDGRYRLYYYAVTGRIDATSQHAIYSAVSTDGVRFTQEKKVFEYAGAVDPDVFWTGAEWLMYVFASQENRTIIARSGDGLDFEYAGPLGLRNWGTTAPIKLADGRFRLYGFKQPEMNVVGSFISSDALNWTQESGTRLTVPAGQQITDPFVVRLPDGLWKMYFKVQGDAPVYQAQPPTTNVPRAMVTIAIGAPLAGKTIQPLLGVNIGPIPSGESGNADVTNGYRQIGVNLVRTHDFYGPLDMSTLYPDRTRDPAVPQSYDFAASDPVWQAMVDGGFEPYFRLGDSWNNAQPPANASERANWVKAAVQVIRHYREGKWNGFKTKFRYVEIWNEPDNQQFWQKPHTPAEFFQLFAETARALKQAFPDLQVGGPGLTPAGALAPAGNKYTQDFLDYMKKNNVPLDFFSWHIYSNDPNDYANAAAFYRAALDRHGYQGAASHITEWNTETKRDAKDALALRAGGKGAAILTAAWINLQEQNVAASLIYRGTDPSIRTPEFYGIFYADGKPKRVALAFSLWSKLVAHPNRLSVTASSSPTLRVLAGQNDAGEIALLVANPTDAATTWRVNLSDGRRLADFKATLWQVNDASDQIQMVALSGATVNIAANTVQLLVLSR